ELTLSAKIKQSKGGPASLLDLDHKKIPDPIACIVPAATSMASPHWTRRQCAKLTMEPDSIAARNSLGLTRRFSPSAILDLEEPRERTRPRTLRAADQSIAHRHRSGEPGVTAAFW